MTINTFRPQYYFSQEQTVGLAAEVHKRYRDDPGYPGYIQRLLPVMLDSHKILSAIHVFDTVNDSNDTVIDILARTRPDHVPDFWITILDYHGELGMSKRNLGARGRRLVWRYLKRVTEKRGLKTVALWFTKNREKWNQVCYRSHASFKGDLELLAAGILFKRAGKLEKIEDPVVKDYLDDLLQVKQKAASKSLTMQDIKQSNLPFRTLEGFASGTIDTKSQEFYESAFSTMTNYEVLRRTGAMLRNGFLDRYHDRWLTKMKQVAKTIDPTEIGSVMLQHPELGADLREPLVTSIDHARIRFPERSVVLCDASRSMKLVKTNASVRTIWELAALTAASQHVPVYLVRDKVEQLEGIEGSRGIARAFGSNEARGPTSLSRGIKAAIKHDPDWIIIISDCQTNIPYRGHEKLVAEKSKSTILTFNPTVNPLEPGAATKIGAKNEVFLPVRGLKFMGKILEVIT